MEVKLFLIARLRRSMSKGPRRTKSAAGHDLAEPGTAGIASEGVFHPTMKRSHVKCALSRRACAA